MGCGNVGSEVLVGARVTAEAWVYRGFDDFSLRRCAYASVYLRVFRSLFGAFEVCVRVLGRVSLFGLSVWSPGRISLFSVVGCRSAS